MPWRSHRLRVLPPGFRVPWVHPSLPHPARGLSDPGPCAECSPLIRVIRVVLWSLRVPPPTPLRARPATGHLIALTSPGLHASALSLRTGCRRPIPAGRGPSRCVRAGTSFGTPDRALMCAPASHLATPAPPLSILRPGPHSGFLPGPFVGNGAIAPTSAVRVVAAPCFNGPARVWCQTRILPAQAA